MYIVALKLKSLKSIFVKIELLMDSCSYHHSSSLKSSKFTKFIIWNNIVAIFTYLEVIRVNQFLSEDSFKSTIFKTKKT